MIGRKIALLDGRQAGDEDLAPASEVLNGLLQQAGAEVRTFTLRELKLTQCIGCFGCWLETPGLCRFRDAGPEIAQAIMESDTIVLFTPLSFGSYAPQLKVMVDRFLPTLLPYFGVYHGEVHHRPRYARYPRWVGIGLQRAADETEAGLFKLLVGRNAINFHAPSYAAEVVQSTDIRARLEETLRSALERNDTVPWREPVRHMMPAGQSLPDGSDAEAGRRALLLVGSPKTKSPSTSGVLGEGLLGRLAAAIREYETRAARYWPLEVREVREESGRSLSSELVRSREAERLAGVVPAGAHVASCERDGRGMSSEEFAQWVQRRREDAKDVAFVIGGAHGLGEAIQRLTATRLSLAPWTLPHELARLVLAEQLYRAGTIVRGEPYHK
jgi:rRNA large subunit m3Psi methyltransferase RlmH